MRTRACPGAWLCETSCPLITFCMMTSGRNEELGTLLMELGFTPGPFTEARRGLYLKKLKEKAEDDDARTLALNASTTAAPSLPPSSFIVSRLLSSLNNVSHLASDTAFLFPDRGALFLASRAVLSTQCCEMIPLLYTGGTVTGYCTALSRCGPAITSYCTAITCYGPSVTGSGPSETGYCSVLTRYGSTVTCSCTGITPSVRGYCTREGSSVTGYCTALTSCGPAKTCYSTTITCSGPFVTVLKRYC